MRRFAVVIMTAVLLLRVPVAALPFRVYAECAVLLNADTGEILFGRGENARMQPASMTKIMTAYVVLASLPLDGTVAVPARAVGAEGSSAYLSEGEVFTVRELLYALLLQSANDAALTLACAFGGVEAFVAEMNKTASSLGLTGTHFSNPHGLPDSDHYSTAYDIARLLIECMKNADFALICGETHYTVTPGQLRCGREFYNHNRLLSECDGVIAGKTGYTASAGRCLCSYYEKDGVRLCAVTMNDPRDWDDHKRLYDYGSSLFRQYVIDVDREFSVHVVGGLTDSAVCRVKKRVTVAVKTGEKPEMTVCMRRFEYAPVAAGQRLGSLLWYVDGRIIYEIKLYADNKVEASYISFEEFFRWKK